MKPARFLFIQPIINFLLIFILINCNKAMGGISRIIDDHLLGLYSNDSIQFDGGYSLISGTNSIIKDDFANTPLAGYCDSLRIFKIYSFSKN